MRWNQNTLFWPSRSRRLNTVRSGWTLHAKSQNTEILFRQNCMTLASVFSSQYTRTTGDQRHIMTTTRLCDDWWMVMCKFHTRKGKRCDERTDKSGSADWALANVHEKSTAITSQSNNSTQFNLTAGHTTITPRWSIKGTTQHQQLSGEVEGQMFKKRHCTAPTSRGYEWQWNT